ncbi:MAG TPA: molybdate ABC transporter substrate-binding protein [Pyrinomonadaceae bacterium]|nr:molybdate ABC transporter substrate-binding protein [Pyrinomonadaceae bacterium]
MKKLNLLSCVLALALFGCRPAPTTSGGDAQPAGEIIVSAAASLKDAFVEIGKIFESRNGVKVNFNFGASGVLQQQIEQAAPVDVFASAGARQMDALAGKGLLAEGSRRDFARNSLVLIVPVDSAPTVKSFAELGAANLKRLAVGNPKTVPVGQYTEQLLTNLKLWDALQTKLVPAGDVRQVLDYVARGEVDAGIVYASDAAVAKDKIKVLESAPAELHDPILYPVAVVKGSQHANAANSFIELVLADEGQSILEKYGFGGVR